jgi:hypothetical protein
LEKKQLMAENKLETEIAEMLRESFRNRKIENVPEHISKLRTAKDMFDKVYDFKAGDLVVWKKALRNKARPALNEPAIVMQHRYAFKGSEQTRFWNALF